MIESVLHWIKEYHIDGFRFDLMGIHDTPLFFMIHIPELPATADFADPQGNSAACGCRHPDQARSVLPGANA